MTDEYVVTKAEDANPANTGGGFWMGVLALVRFVAERLPWAVLGPLIFLLVCMPLVYVCPEADQSKLIFLIVGAALTRVKISLPAPPATPPPDDPPPGK